MDYYNRVKQLAKKKKNQTLQEFILSMGLNPDTYYSMKKAGNLPRADEALKVAQALDTTVEFLLTGTEPDSLIRNLINEILALVDRYTRHTLEPSKKATLT